AARVLGTILIVIGMLSVGLTAPFVTKQTATVDTLALIALGAVHIVPGILFWGFSESFRGGKEWAGIVILVLASLVALGEAASVGRSLVQVASGAFAIRG